MSGVDALAEIVRAFYIERSTGILEQPLQRPLYVQDGELYLSRDYPRAEAVEKALAECQGLPAADPTLSEITVTTLQEWILEGERTRFNADWEGLPDGLIGPLPTVLAVLDLVVRDAGRGKLMRRLGGPDARYRSVATGPAMQQLPGLDMDMGQVMVRLETPVTVHDLKQICPGVNVLQGLTKLRAVGLAEEVATGRRGRAGSDVAASTATARNILEMLSDRIQESLYSDPLQVPTEEHQAMVVSQFALLNANHYEFLNVGIRADDNEILAAYRRIGRRVHPLNASILDLEDKQDLLRLLFEKATKAYLTLSDPTRRSSYNTLEGFAGKTEVDEKKRLKERQEMAAHSYRIALHFLSVMQRDYSPAVDLMREATRLDPRAEYFALLGRAEAQNPQWRPDAIKSYREAIKLEPKNAGHHVGLAELLELEDRREEALEEYNIALELMPDNVEAQKSIKRLRRTPLNILKGLRG